MNALWYIELHLLCRKGIHRSYVHLAPHLEAVHNMDRSISKSYRQKHKLNKTRAPLPQELRKSKLRVYKPRICPMAICNEKVIKRLDNHLRQYHKLPKDKAREASKAAPYWRGDG